MEYNEFCKWAMVMATCVMCCEASSRRLRLTKHSLVGRLDGLGCAVDRHLTARGVKFSTKTGTCDTLTEEWFSSPPKSLNKRDITFYCLVKGELVFEPTMSILGVMTQNLVVGSSVVLYIRTGERDNDIFVTFESLDRSEQALQIRISVSQRDIVFSSRLGGSLGVEETATYSLMASNSVYKLEVVLNQTSYEIKINDSNHYSYMRSPSLANFKRFSFEGTSSFLEALEYYFPAY